MAGIRDDSAGPYGQWLTPDDWSWLDHVKAGAYDTGNALATAGEQPFDLNELLMRYSAQ